MSPKVFQDGWNGANGDLKEKWGYFGEPNLKKVPIHWIEYLYNQMELVFELKNHKTAQMILNWIFFVLDNHRWYWLEFLLIE